MGLLTYSWRCLRLFLGGGWGYIMNWFCFSADAIDPVDLRKRSGYIGADDEGIWGAGKTSSSEATNNQGNFALSFFLIAYN